MNVKLEKVCIHNRKIPIYESFWPTLVPAVSLMVSQIVRIETIFHTANITLSIVDFLVLKI